MATGRCCSSLNVNPPRECHPTSDVKIPMLPDPPQNHGWIKGVR